MSEKPDLHAMVHAQFQKAFGEPDRMMGKDWHWSLPPTPGAVPINVLVNGSPAHPAVWVFDPHGYPDGVDNIIIRSEDQTGGVIERIQERLSRAAHRSHSSR